MPPTPLRRRRPRKILPVEWVPGFYSTTGRWWGGAESAITERDHARAATIARLAGPAPADVLELGCAYAHSAAAAADAGYRVVGIEISDRLDFADRHRAGRSIELVRGDFYAVDLGRTFDAVVYWNGFGVGSDADQRRLLRRIADEWLRPEGVALIDVANPFGWARWAAEGEGDDHDPDPARGYVHRGIQERIDFDPVGNRAVDSWWERPEPERVHTQSIRCYTPADFRLLLEGTGLALDHVEVGGEPLALGGGHTMASPLWQANEYLARLRPATR
jgi:SAM-dependent methyltransferase